MQKLGCHFCWPTIKLQLVLVGLIVTAACAEPQASITYRAHVKPIFDAHCVQCHHADGIAPFALTTYTDARAYRFAIRAAVENRTMPPWPAKRGIRPYRYDISLSDEQIATISAWVNAGAPEGSQPASRPLHVEKPKLSRIDTTLAMPEPYTPLRIPDDYRCFLIDWPRQETAYISGFRALAGVPTQVHHIAVFLASPGDVATVSQWDEADAGPGYTCFGGPSGSNAKPIPIQLVAAWVPGVEGQDYPEGTGIRVDPGSKLILQMHYNLANRSPLPDQTRLQFKIDAQAEHPAAFAPWLDTRWPTEGMHIAAGATDAVHRVTGDPRLLFLAFTGGLRILNGFTIHSVMMHMHTLGTSARVAIERGPGKSESLLEIPRWNFNWQREYVFAQPVAFQPGDALTVECHWDNSGTAGPPPPRCELGRGNGRRDVRGKLLYLGALGPVINTSQPLVYRQYRGAKQC